MAYNPYNSRQNSSRPSGGYNNGNRNAIPVIIEAQPLPTNYVDKAEEVIRNISQERNKISTNKIRNLLSLVMELYNRENLRTEEQIAPESESGLVALRIRAVYEAGRDDAVKTFIKESNLISYIKDIGTSREKLLHFAHYMEALVAYHRYYIGKKEG